METALPSTSRDTPTESAFEQVLHWARRTPRAPAIIEGQRSFDYASLAAAIDEIAELLRSRGVGPGDRVLIFAENNVGAVASLFAAQTLGAWPAVVNSRMPAAEISALKDLVEPRLAVFALADSPATADHALRESAVTAEPLLAGPIALSATNRAAVPEPDPERPEDRVGLLMFTSGTTGRAKAVMHSHRNLTVLGETLRQSRHVSATDCYNGVAPLAHIMGIANLLSVVAAGASLRLMPRLELPKLAAGIADGTISHLSFVPTIYARLLDYIDANAVDISGHCLRYISVGGAPLDATLQNRVQSRFGIALVNGYGMTECVPGTRTAADRFSPAGCIGLPEAGVQVRVVDDEGREAEANAVGEIWLHAPGAMLGYYRNPADTATAKRPGGWIATGDLGRRLENGEFAIVGRKKEMIIHSGFNVYPAEVEAALNSLPQLEASGVVGRRLADGDEEVVAFVELRPEQTLSAADIDTALRALIAPYKRPGRIVFLDHLPLGATGKIWKARLAAMAAELGEQSP